MNDHRPAPDHPPPPDDEKEDHKGQRPKNYPPLPWRSGVLAVVEQRAVRDEGMDHIELQQKSKPEDDRQAYDVECPLGYDRSNQFVGRHFFVPRQDRALHDLPKPRCAKVDEITDHYPEETIHF